MENNEIEVLKDSLILGESLIEVAKKKKEVLDDYNTKIAGIMEKLKTDEIRQQLAVITQENYKSQIELEINLAQLEKEHKIMKSMLGMLGMLGMIENGRN